MRLKTIVGIALFFSIVIGGSIILIGLLDSYFIYAYFIFITILVSIAAYSLKENFNESKDLGILFIIAICTIVAFLLFASGVKNYYDTNNQFMEKNSQITGQVDNLTRLNNYYKDYIDFLNKDIANVQNNSASLQNKITLALNSELNSQVSNPPIQPNPITLENTEPRDREREEQDD
jgi:hypothetical protein